MEDFAPVLWVLVVIGAGIYSIITEARKKAAKGSEKHAHDEAWPSWGTPSVPQWMEATTKKDLAAPELEFEDGTDAEPAFTDESRYIESEAEMQGGRYAFQYIPLTTTNPTPDEAQPAAPDHIAGDDIRESAANSEGSDMTEDFDLRKAVIYAEILKPKFDE